MYTNDNLMGYILNTMYVLSEFFIKLLKQQKQLPFLFRSYKPIYESTTWLPDPSLDRGEIDGNC